MIICGKFMIIYVLFQHETKFGVANPLELPINYS